MNNYSLNARVYPIMIFCMPALITAVLLSVQFNHQTHIFASLGIIGALSYLFSQVCRDSGKKKEPSLWKYFGGAPTTQILRWRDSRINHNTKKRYHDKLNQLCPLDNNPNLTFEQNNPDEADIAYEAWTKYLISKTRDTTKFRILFKENMNYGFRRNLWGMKTYAIVFMLLLMAGVLIRYWNQVQSLDYKIYPLEFMVAEVVLFLTLMFWIIKINRDWVKLPAFAYSERLLEATEEL